MIQPEGITSTGWPAVRDTCARLGLLFDPWQDGAGRLIMAKRKDGLYAADTAVLSIPRQVGKTYLIGAIVFALCVIHPGLTVIWTAHRTRTAGETFKSMQATARRSRVAPHVERVMLGSGTEAVLFKNGSRVLFGARERGFGRGFADVGVLVLDEAQILTESAMEDMTPATNVAANPLIVMMGTPPRPKDPGEVFSMLRTEALRGGSSGTLYIELSAERGCSPLDRAQWRAANPSHPHRTSERAMLRMWKNLSEASFLREALGVWDDTAGASSFGEGRWDSCVGEELPGLTPGALAIASSMDMAMSAIGAASVDGDGVTQVKPLQHGPGSAWVVARVAELQAVHDVPAVIDGRGPAAMLIPHLELAGVRLHVASTSDVLDSCADIYNKVQEHRLRHAAYPELDAAVSSAVKRDVGERWAWGRRVSNADISTLEAVTLASWYATRPTEQPAQSVYETRGVLTI